MNLRAWIRQKLGIDDLECQIADLERSLVLEKAKVRSLYDTFGKFNRSAVDVASLKHSESTIIVISHLDSGRVEIIPCRFRDLRELRHFVQRVEDSWGINERNSPRVVDAPPSLEDWRRGW